MSGKIIKKLRKENNMTLKQLAYKLGFNSPSTIGMIERGERSISIETLDKLRKTFNISADYILDNWNEDSN